MEALLTALQKADVDAAARPQFYKTFLESRVVIPVLNDPSELRAVDGLLPEGTSLKVRKIALGDHEWVLVFSSPETLSMVLPDGTPYVQLSGRVFLRMFRGSYVILNAGLTPTKGFSPEEIDDVLSGSALGEAMAVVEIPEGEQVGVGQPATYPHELIAALKAALTQNPVAEAAYLAHCILPNQGGHPHSVIGLVTERMDEAVKILAPVAKGCLGDTEYVDFLQIRKGEFISDYMVKETKPFFTARRGGFWKRLLGG